MTIVIQLEAAENVDVILSEIYYQYLFLGKLTKFWNNLTAVTWLSWYVWDMIYFYYLL